MKEILKNSISLARIKDIPLILQVIKKNNYITNSGIKRELKIAINKATDLKNGVVNMKLVEANHGLHLSEIGEKWLSSYQKEEKVPSEVIKNAYLNVLIFKNIYEELPNVSDPNFIHETMAGEIRKLDQKADSKLIGSITRRYLEGIYGVYLPRYFRWKTKIDSPKVKNSLTSHVNNKVNKVIDSNKSEKIVNLMLPILNREQKDILLRQLLTKI